MRTATALAALTLAALPLTACAKSSDTKQEIKAPVTTASAPSTEQRRETIFLDATATHLCAIQSQVYTDPAAMASAYATEPLYTDLTPAQVDEFQQRVIADPAFADRLTQRIQQTCGTAK
jgi:hypothetical protein